MYNAVALRNLGEAMIINTLSSAYYAMTKHPIYKRASRYAEGSDCLAFIQSDRFRETIEMFGLDVDPDRLRETFFVYVELA